jgi:hypothetical protein
MAGEKPQGGLRPLSANGAKERDCRKQIPEMIDLADNKP